MTYALRTRLLTVACCFGVLFGFVLRVAAGQADGADGLTKQAPERSIFLAPIPADQLGSLRSFAGVPAKELFHDKQFRKVMKSFVPSCEFHYGRDMPLADALDMTIGGSRTPVEVRDGRYLMVSGDRGPYLGGRAMLWVDLQEGIGLGAFYFRPTNGEPTPTVNVFSRQVKEEFLGLSEMPLAFVEDFARWSQESRVEFVTTRYFLTGGNKKILLEHDEDYCLRVDGTTAPQGGLCERMNADAADFDLTAAYYVEQTHHATNATAWMMSGDETAWLRVRANTCGVLVGCRILMTRRQVGLIVGRPPRPRPR